MPDARTLPASVRVLARGLDTLGESRSVLHINRNTDQGDTMHATTEIDARNITHLRTDADFATLVGQELAEVHETGPVTSAAISRAQTRANIVVTTAKNLHRIDDLDAARLRNGISRAVGRTRRDLGL